MSPCRRRLRREWHGDEDECARDEDGTARREHEHAWDTGAVWPGRRISGEHAAEDVDGGIEFFAVPPEPGGDPVAEGAVDREQLAWLEGVDAILLGANPYRMFAEYWPTADPGSEPVAEPIARLPKHVVSNSLARAPWGDGEIEVLRGDAEASVADLKERFDAIVLSTLPPGRSHWLKRNVVRRLEGTTRLRVIHVIGQPAPAPTG